MKPFALKVGVEWIRFTICFTLFFTKKQTFSLKTFCKLYILRLSLHSCVLHNPDNSFTRKKTLSNFFVAKRDIDSRTYLLVTLLQLNYFWEKSNGSYFFLLLFADQWGWRAQSWAGHQAVRGEQGGHHSTAGQASDGKYIDILQDKKKRCNRINSGIDRSIKGENEDYCL